MKRNRHLTTADMFRLDLASSLLRRLLDGPVGGVYLVGSVEQGAADWRDVDVRLILPDDQFDAMFGSKPALWETFSYAVSRWLSTETDLPVDFQVQRMTEANGPDHEGKPRNPLGTGKRHFAGLGDATPYFAELAADWEPPDRDESE